MNENKKLIVKKIPAFIPSLLLFLILFAGGIYILIYNAHLMILGIISVISSIPIFILLLKYVVKTDLHGILDVFSVIIGIFSAGGVLALFLIRSDFTALFYNVLWIQIIAISGSTAGFIIAFFLSKRKSFRLGGILLVICSIFMYYGIIALIVGGI